MQELKDRIRKDGIVREGNVLKVDSFLNHQIDVGLLENIGKAFRERFAGEDVTKILTIEASGIAIAAMTAQVFHVPVLFAKKTKTKNIAGPVYTSRVESYTHGTVYDIVVSRDFLKPEDKVLIVDDFLAKGKALIGLTSLVRNAGATLVGAGIVIEKGFQEGGRILREEMGVRVESLAIISSMSVDSGVVFAESAHEA